MNITKHIPNFITLLNLLSGCVAISLALRGEIEYAFCCIVAATLFDFLDGFMARLLKAYSLLGKELDSLADLVSFGVAPSLLVFGLLSKMSPPAYLTPIAPLLPYTAFVIALFSAYRLAKFNIDERQTTSFIGLPTPASAFLWIGIVSFASSYEVHYLSILATIVLMSYLLVAEIPMFSLKFTHYRLKGNIARYLLLIVALPLLFWFGWSGLALLIAFYTLLSLIRTMV